MKDISSLHGSFHLQDDPHVGHCLLLLMLTRKFRDFVFWVLMVAIYLMLVDDGCVCLHKLLNLLNFYMHVVYFWAKPTILGVLKLIRGLYVWAQIRLFKDMQCGVRL